MEQATEVRAQELPPPSIETLNRLRQENCSGSSKDFRLQSFQLFLRRILSPDSPTRNMLLFHGTGVGKTCTAIQVAEEYILRPEFQDKKVLVLASAAVQENFKTQIFDVTRVKQDKEGLLTAQQCTGRRYLEMLERAQTEGLRWENPESREKLNSIVQSMIDDFYDFSPYQGWGNKESYQYLSLSPKDYEAWVHETYDGRLLIVDEAHNLRDEEDANKAVAAGLTRIVKIAKGMTLILLSATPMYDKFDEILFFFNLFLWNDKRQGPDEMVAVSDIFKKNGEFKKETEFRSWCHEYVSFLRGENPFTFPFRLPPPDNLIAPLDRTTDMKGQPIATPRKYLPLTQSLLQSPQLDAVKAIKGGVKDGAGPTIVVSHDGRSIVKCFEKGSDIAKALFKYGKGVPPLMSPSNLPKYATKFATIMNCITETSGIVFVYSNYIRGGAQQFAMALEEAGFSSAVGPRMLETTSGEYTGPSRGKYAYLTSDMDSRQIEKLIRRLRSPANRTGQDIRIIIGTFIISEGIDFKRVRQIHILDPWYNMSRIEQIIGRGLRTCSHSDLEPEDQNCTVYLHIVRYPDSTQETYDEAMYRVFVEEKASQIANVKRILSESAIDCSSQIATNRLPEAWRNLEIPQRRSQDPDTLLRLPLASMSAPTFENGAPALVCMRTEKVSEDYVRPLGSYFDIRDEVFDSIIHMFEEKPVWSTEDLRASPNLKYAPEVVTFLLQDAINTHLKLKDTNGRVGVLDNKDGMYSFSPNGIPNGTAIERSTPLPTNKRATVPVNEEEEEAEQTAEIKADVLSNEEILESYVFPIDVSEFTDDVKRWYIVDQQMAPEKKVALLQSFDRDTEDKPVWAQGNVFGDFLAISPTQIYNKENVVVEPVGEEKDALKQWVSTHVDIVVENINASKIMCTVEKGELKFAAFDVVDGHASRITRTKTITPKTCDFYKQPALVALVQDCMGHGFPASIGVKTKQCLYLSLAVRTASLANSDRVFWVTPEVWSFVSKESATVRARIA